MRVYSIGWLRHVAAVRALQNGRQWGGEGVGVSDLGESMLLQWARRGPFTPRLPEATTVRARRGRRASVAEHSETEHGYNIVVGARTAPGVSLMSAWCCVPLRALTLLDGGRVWRIGACVLRLRQRGSACGEAQAALFKCAAACVDPYSSSPSAALSTLIYRL